MIGSYSMKILKAMRYHCVNTEYVKSKILVFADLDIDSKYRWSKHIWQEGYYPQCK